MAARSGSAIAALRQLLRPPSPSSQRPRPSSWLSFLRRELISRRLPLLYDNPIPLPSYLLTSTLADFLPPSDTPIPDVPPDHDGQEVLRPAHHLIYFPPFTPLSSLLPDGTDPNQSPGDPFVRRMWAGGRISFSPNKNPPLPLRGERSVCLEAIRDVKIKGREGEEKVFVEIERRISSMEAIKHERDEDQIRKALYREDAADPGPCAVVENRTIVFMRERSPALAADAAKANDDKIVKAAHAPTFSHTLRPTAALLFRYSALTFNAHSIHLDRLYCQEVEGHRNLLVHGPLSLTLIVELLGRYVAREGGPKAMVQEIEYRNLAPLYAEEAMTVCGREGKESGDWEVWIEGRGGGLAVRGVARTG
ncbi:MAG: hypothetical protein FRX48_09073 [Lasallia pustulata]|uniref:HotDog domain n=1 Tax=Lasallia pustulata TaxID=136370 RepID=A0A5M8PDA8_9LECA|nr:MAG: hypothetical protein FRX48_09073 [Lasallia pustulata]